MNTTTQFVPARGFTLIELLVVLVIIGLVAAGAVLAIGTTGRDSALEKETERLGVLVEYVREQAELGTREYGLRCEGDSYEFVVLDQRRGIWAVIETDDVLRPRELPPGLQLRLRIEGREITFKPLGKDDQPLPQIMLFSNGDVTSFEVSLSREGSTERAFVRTNERGEIERVLPVEAKT